MDFETRAAAISGEARDGFRMANPVQFGRTQGNVDTTRRLAAIETRASDIKQRFRDHFDKQEESWVAREALKLWAKRNRSSLEHPAPQGYNPREFTALMMGQARNNVHARATQRLTKINGIKTRMQNTVVRNTPGRNLEQVRQPSNDVPRSPRNKRTGP